jgi:hypothetical protein
VYARSGGVSTSEFKPGVTGSQKAWQIRQGETVPVEILITEEVPGGGHWLWEAAYDMPIVDYLRALAVVNTLFI